MDAFTGNRAIRHGSVTALRAAGVWALLGMAACGGGGSGAPAGPSSPVQALGSAPGIDALTSGRPVDLRVARSPNGDGFVVWRTDENGRHDLWASRHRGGAADWDAPVNIEASGDDISADFDVTADAAGNAVVAWTERGPFADRATAARFDATAGTWGAPVELGSNPYDLSLAGDATGAAVVGYSVGFGRAFDPAQGAWQPQAVIADARIGTGYTFGPVPALDGSGHALAVFHYSRTGGEFLASNVYSFSTGRWDQLPPDAEEGTVIGAIPGSTVFGFVPALQVSAAGAGRFVAAWQSREEGGASDLRIARFTTASRTWGEVKIPVAGDADRELALQRLGADTAGNALLVWTEFDGTRTALRAVRYSVDGAPCGGAATVDAALGGAAAQADLAVDAAGGALAVWAQFDGDRPADGTASNLAIARFDAGTGAWTAAAVAETEPGAVSQPHVRAAAGQALVGWIQVDAGVPRVHALELAVAPAAE